MKGKFGPTLPSQLLGGLGSSDSNGNFKPTAKAKKELGSRKERRKALRAEKKARRQRPRNPSTSKVSQSAEGDDDFIADPWGRDEDSSEDEIAQKPLKSILKKQSKQPRTGETEQKPKSPPPKTLTKQKDVFVHEDVEITALEKKLGIKSKTKLPKSFEEDGLGTLLDGLDDFVASTGKRKREDYEAWLKNKRRKEDTDVFEGFSDEDEDFPIGDAVEKQDDHSDSVSGLEFDDEDDSEDLAMEWSRGQDSEGTDDEELEDSVDSEAEIAEDKPRVRENPYRPPILSETQIPDSKPEQKYIPPALRAASTSDEEILAKLRRQLQGLLNRLSEANMLSIIKDVEQIYQSNSRQHVTSTLTELLLGLMSDRTSLNDTFITQHAAFISAIYKAIGPSFGAHLLSRLVASIDAHHGAQSSAAAPTKEATNLLALLAELYTFHVVGSAPLLDYARSLLAELTPLNAELVLAVARIAGAQLRSDDPGALKGMAALAQRGVAAAGGPANVPPRTAVMVDALVALPSGRPARSSAVAAEMRARLRRALGPLSARAVASEPLGVGLEDVRRAGEGGRQWWVVGGVWKGGAAEKSSGDAEAEGDAETEDVETLAKRAGMNTAIRRAVFTTLLQSHDYKDCCDRLRKMRLSRRQELEIPRVLLHCVGAEQTYNKYYTLVARRLCAEHRMRMAFQFALWGVFRGFGERFVGGSAGEETDMEPDEDYGAGTNLRKVINLAKMYGDLIAGENLPVTILKTLDFAYLKEKTKLLVEVMLVNIMQSKSKDEEAVIRIFSKAREALQMATGLKYFIENVVVQTDVVDGKKDRDIVKKGCKAATATLSLLAQSIA